MLCSVDTKTAETDAFGMMRVRVPGRGGWSTWERGRSIWERGVKVPVVEGGWSGRACIEYLERGG